jgi:hypothetical protein
MENIEPSDITIEMVQACATLRQEVNGVQWWTQNLHPNVHYLIAGRKVYMRHGYAGRCLFNWFAHGRMIYDL